MHLDADGKPDLETICQQAQAFAQTAQAAVYVTQSLVCQNAYGEVEYIAKGDSCAYAMYLAIAFRAQELVQRIQAKEIYIPNDNQKAGRKQRHDVLLRRSREPHQCRRSSGVTPQPLACPSISD